MSKEEADSSMLIPKFYAGRSIFITGGTGFLGKVLVEKILRSCPEVREIFLLMRPKKEMSIDNRLRKMLSLPLFDKLREERPSCFEKLIPVRGDVTQEGLGLPPVERRVIIERVSIIFHVAANVRFDDKLKDAIFVNLRSTRDVCILAGSMKNLISLVHVSSTYAHADKPHVEEIAYEANIDWKKVIKMAETVDEHILNTFSSKYLGAMPNTYTFTKRLAELVISDYAKVLPSVIFRPSIVISSFEEPVRGWIDNFNGPVGMMVGGGKGVLRAVFADKKASSDYMPVDMAIKTMMIAAWKRGMKTVTEDPDVYVYNCASNNIKSISMEELIAIGLYYNERIPLDGIIWHPAVTITRCRVYYYLLVLLTHLLPAVLIDGLLKLSGRKPMLVRLQRKVYISNMALSYFTTNDWSFSNEKLLKLLNDLSPENAKDFGFVYENFDIPEFFKNCLYASKMYLLHEDVTQLDKSKAHFNSISF
ncbi:fatty acyl-CoA reductase 1-like isoform X2 [Prorops nasuta]|uniref:fatty acyl-CoA reductase 1-like isoform X2 n=1 Tax=Prorops nasuta TaxID=863751 RepID=UPI0034D01F61